MNFLFQLKWSFTDADEFHSQENKLKMSSGQPLTDQVQSLPYFFGYKTEFFFFFQNTDLDLLDCLGRVNLVLQLNFIGLIYLFKSF